MSGNDSIRRASGDGAAGWAWRLVALAQVAAASYWALHASAWAPAKVVSSVGDRFLQQEGGVGCSTPAWAWAQFALPVLALLGAGTVAVRSWNGRPASQARSARLTLVALAATFVVWVVVHFDLGGCLSGASY